MYIYFSAARGESSLETAKESLRHVTRRRPQIEHMRVRSLPLAGNRISKTAAANTLFCRCVSIIDVAFEKQQENRTKQDDNSQDREADQETITGIEL